MLSAMKKMQIMIHLLLIEVEIPATCQIFFGSLLKLVTYELIDISQYIKNGLKLHDDVGFSENFEQLGYQSSYSIVLLGNLYIALIALILGIILFFSTRRCTSSERFNKLRAKLQSVLIWHGTLGLFNESYIVICVSCFVNITVIKSGLTFGETFSLANACLLLLVVLGYPILILTILLKNQPNLHKSEYRDQFGEFYLQFRYKEGKTKVLEPFYSALRRLVQIAAVVFLK
jgi:succinate dehydrogenase/fumarate reductase cytochrome b subunit